MTRLYNIDNSTGIIEAKSENTSSREVLTSKAGVSLIEVLVVAALFTVVTGSVLSMFLFTNRVWQGVRANAQVLQETRLLMTYMERELRQAFDTDSVSSVEVRPAPAGTENVRVEIQTRVQDSEMMVAYRINVVGGVRRIQRATYPIASTVPGDTDASWITLVNNVDRLGTDQFFSFTSGNFTVGFLAFDTERLIRRPLRVQNRFQVRVGN